MSSLSCPRVTGREWQILLADLSLIRNSATRLQRVGSCPTLVLDGPYQDRQRTEIGHEASSNRYFARSFRCPLQYRRAAVRRLRTLEWSDTLLK